MGLCTHAQTQVRLQNVIQRAPDTNAQQLNCSGTVTDAAGSPVAGATVEYWRYEGRLNRLELKKQITTGADGSFGLEVSRATGFLLAQKPGLAPAWKQLNQPFNPVGDTEEHLVLTTPTALAGVVVDEADKPVANAGVSAAMAVCEISREDGARSFNYLNGKPARDCFAARTDAAGRFRIENFPANATAALMVEAPGKALRQSSQDSGGLDSLPWRAGQNDIKLVVEPAGSIEGKIIVEGSNQPPPVARLTLQPDRPGFVALSEREPAQSGADGAFHISDVAAGSYRIHAVFGTNAVPEWVADTVPVSVESGQTTRGVQVTAVRGGLLEVAVLGQNDRKPLAQVMVNAYKENFQSAASSDSNGIAFLRLPPGDYQVAASRESMAANQTSASVEAGQTNRVEIEIAAPKKITGIVRQPDGQPAAGLLVRMVGGYGPNAGEVKTDADGKFELEWNQRQFGQNDTTACILVRDAEHNLAVAQDIDEDTGPLDLKLAPGLTLAGRAESDGKPVTNATATLVFWTGRSGMWLDGLARTNTPGRFEIPALPPGRKYGVVVSAPGYGQRRFTMSAPPPRPSAGTGSGGAQTRQPQTRRPGARRGRQAGRRRQRESFRRRPAQREHTHGPRGTIPLRACLRRPGSNLGQQPEFVRQRFGGRRRHERRSAARPNLQQLPWFHGAQTERHGDGRRRQTRRRRAGGGVSVQWFGLDKNRDQRRVQPHLVAPAVANAVGRGAAGGPRPGPQSGGHGRVARGHDEPRREIETGPDRGRAGKKCRRFSACRRAGWRADQGRAWPTTS